MLPTLAWPTSSQRLRSRTWVLPRRRRPAGLDCYYLGLGRRTGCDSQNNVESWTTRETAARRRASPLPQIRVGRAATTASTPKPWPSGAAAAGSSRTSNTDGEQSVGQVSSPDECIEKAMDQCPGFEIANLPEYGVGECWCQQGASPLPDSSGYQCINQIVAARPIFARFSYRPLSPRAWRRRSG